MIAQLLGSPIHKAATEFRKTVHQSSYEPTVTMGQMILNLTERALPVIQLAF